MNDCMMLPYKRSSNIYRFDEIWLSVNSPEGREWLKNDLEAMRGFKVDISYGIDEEITVNGNDIKFVITNDKFIICNKRETIINLNAHNVQITGTFHPELMSFITKFKSENFSTNIIFHWKV